MDGRELGDPETTPGRWRGTPPDTNTTTPSTNTRSTQPFCWWRGWGWGVEKRAWWRRGGNGGGGGGGSGGGGDGGGDHGCREGEVMMEVLVVVEV